MDSERVERLHERKVRRQSRVVQHAQVEQVFQIVNARRRHALREKRRLQILLRALMSVVADDIRHRLLAASVERRGAAIVRLGFIDPFVNERRADKAPSPC